MQHICFRYIYEFGVKSKGITFNPSFYSFFARYKNVLEKINYFEWVKFLERVNPEESSYRLATILDNSTKRKDLSKYRELLQKETDAETCFYCSKKLNNAIEVDHFIPWSFVKDDKIWNLVLACKDCNGNKKDKLTDPQYINDVLLRNDFLMRKREISLQYFRSYHNDLIKNIYDCAAFNGWKSGWKTTRKV